MSLLSKFESTLSYIGFMVGAPSISLPLDATGLLLTSAAALFEDDTKPSIEGMLQIDFPKSHFDEGLVGVGLGDRKCGSPAPGSGQLDCFGDIA